MSVPRLRRLIRGEKPLPASISVSTEPGSTATAISPDPLSSSATLFIRPTTPHLLAQ